MEHFGILISELHIPLDRFCETVTNRLFSWKRKPAVVITQGAHLANRLPALRGIHESPLVWLSIHVTRIRFNRYLQENLLKIGRVGGTGRE